MNRWLSALFMTGLSLFAWHVTALEVNFNNHNEGTYGKDSIARDWPGVDSAQGKERMKIVSSAPFGRKGNCLSVFTPKGAVGPVTGGAQFVVPIEARDEYYLSYYVHFCKGFDFKNGGKLPGLTSGGASASGGKHNKGYNWSARFTWGANGSIAVYLYHVDKKRQWGDILPLPGCVLRHEKWHRITQRIRLNTGKNKDGLLQVWFDEKKVLDRDDICYRYDMNGPIDSMYFSTFHGGSGAKYAPESDSLVCFDDFTVATSSGAIFGKKRSKPLAEAEQDNASITTAPSHLGESMLFPTRPKVDDAVLKACDKRLLARLNEALKSGKSPRLYMNSFGIWFQVQGFDEDGKMVLRSPVTILRKKWNDLKLTDRKNLALALLRESEEDDHCLAAFYLIADGDRDEAKKHLRAVSSKGKAAAVLGLFSSKNTEQAK